MFDNVLTLYILNMLINNHNKMSSTLNTTLNIRIDRKLKEDASKKFKKIGLGISSGMKMILNQVVANNIELGPRMHYEMTPKQEKWVRKQVAEAKRGKSYKTVKELFDDIFKD